MKFGERLGAHLTPEWRTQYVRYDEMKEFLYAAEEKLPTMDEITDETLQLHFAKYDVGFFNFCDKELKKVNTFFAEKLAEASRRFNELELEIANTGVERLKTVVRNSILYTEDDLVRLEKERELLLARKKLNILHDKKKLSNMKFVIGEFYFSLVLIQNFQKLNFTAFRKILKKHDKIFKNTTGAEYRVAKVETAMFKVNKDINELITNTETIAIEDLEGGDRSKAMKRLRVPPLSEKQKSGHYFFWGLFSGMWLMLFILISIKLYTTGESQFPAYCKHSVPNNNNQYDNSSISYDDKIEVTHNETWEPAIRMYRGFLIILFMLGLLGVNVYGWQQAGVNHVLIFELDPRHHLLATEFLMIGSLFGVLWSISCVLFLTGWTVIPIYTHPVAFVSFLFLFFLNPTKTFWYRSRRWLMKVLFRIICAPFYPVTFADFWLADQLTSLVIPLRDFVYLICFYGHDIHQGGEKDCICTNPKVNFMHPIVALLPSWFRFAQCIRRYYDTHKPVHLVNAGKYFASIMVTMFSTIASVNNSKDNFSSPLTIIWIICLILSTIFSLTWDLYMDWGLFAEFSGENIFLREETVYRYKAYYYLAIIGNIFLRFLKPLTVSMGSTPDIMNQELFLFLLGVCETLRRFIWNFFRLENEHLNNCGEFRAVRDISIMPMESSQDEISKNQFTMKGFSDSFKEVRVKFSTLTPVGSS